jgi:hypothetical protein
MVKGTLGKIPKKSPHFEEFFFEIAKKFRGFGQISSFLLLELPYLANRF